MNSNDSNKTDGTEHTTTEERTSAMPKKPKTKNPAGTFARNKLFLEKEVLKNIISLVCVFLAGLIGFIVAHFKEKASFDEQLRVLHQTAALNLTNAVKLQFNEHSNSFFHFRQDLSNSLILQERSFSNQYAILHDSMAQGFTNALHLQQEQFNSQWDQFQRSSAILLTNEFSTLFYANMLTFSNRLAELKVASADAEKKWVTEQKYANLKSQYDNKRKLLADFRQTFSRCLFAEDDLNILLLSGHRMQLIQPKYTLLWEQGKADRWHQLRMDHNHKVWAAKLRMNDLFVNLVVLLDTIVITFDNDLHDSVYAFHRHLLSPASDMLIASDPRLLAVVDSTEKSKDRAQVKLAHFDKILKEVTQSRTNQISNYYFDLARAMGKDILDLRTRLNLIGEPPINFQLILPSTSTSIVDPFELNKIKSPE